MKNTLGKKEKIFVTLGLLAVLGIWYACKLPCLFQAIFQIPCPTCGMTRAYLALFRLDIRGAFSHHSLFWVIPILYLFFLTDGNFFKKKALNLLFLVAVLALFLIRWFCLLISF
ncbi:MAG: DUF2752 domain-containing protein [Clostridia bacterium]|nr:DUF2752 domain-containing protein [Clostridia bacterium]